MIMPTKYFISLTYHHYLINLNQVKEFQRHDGGYVMILPAWHFFTAALGLRKKNTRLLNLIVCLFI